MTKIRQLVSFMAFAAICTACTGKAAPTDSPERAQGETPIRYVVCSPGGTNCILAARFTTLGNCESHKRWSEMLCESVSTPGEMLCKANPDSAVESYCTK